MTSNEAWFVPKRRGYGASPASWQGWLVTGLFVAAIGLDAVFVGDPLRWIVGGLLIVGFVGAVYAATRGQWRWRDRPHR